MKTAQIARDASTRIRLRMSRTAADIIEIGRDLQEVKRQLGHGNFLKWIKAEFEMSRVTADRFIQVSEQLGSKCNTVLHLPPTILYALAAPSTPEEVRTEVVERVDVWEILADRFSASTSKATGRPERAIQRDAERGKRLGDDLNRIAGTSLDKGVEPMRFRSKSRMRFVGESGNRSGSRPAACASSR